MHTLVRYSVLIQVGDTALYSTTLQATLCDFICIGIQRLLCCEIPTDRSIASNFSPFGTSYHSNVQTVVIHNNLEYGGAGYISSNVATTSINLAGPLVAIHELGHSLFELADEYPSGSGTSSRANCDGSTCSKWTNLQNSVAVQSEYGVMGCQPGCQNDSRYVG